MTNRLRGALRGGAAAACRDPGLAAAGQAPDLLARLAGARRILEIGTLGGYSTIWLARALPAGGQPRHARVRPPARRGRPRPTSRAPGSATSSISGSARRSTACPGWPPRAAGPFDLVFIDADKANNPDYLDWALRLTRPGSLIVADNVVRDGRWPTPPATTRASRACAGSTRSGRGSAVEARHPDRRGQGYDGFAIALVLG